MPTPSNLKFKGALRVLVAFIEEVVTLRRTSSKKRGDLLAAYLEMRDTDS
jgi:hypothetical protein